MGSRKGKTTGLDDENPDPGVTRTSADTWSFAGNSTVSTRIRHYCLENVCLEEDNELLSDDDFVQQQVAILRQVEEDNDRRTKGQPKKQPPLPESDMTHSTVDTSDTMLCQHPARTADEPEDDFTTFLSDPQVIREQRRLFEQIQRETQTNNNLDACTSRVSEQVARLSSQVKETAVLQKQHHLSDQTCEGSGLDKTFPTDNVMKASQDRVATLGNGKKLRVKGTKHVYEAIAQGDALIVQCPCCRAILQVATSTVNLYCTLCQQVSSVELIKETALSTTCDNLIAGSLQQQEIDVACARKMTKLSSRSSE